VETHNARSVSAARAGDALLPALSSMMVMVGDQSVSRAVRTLTAAMHQHWNDVQQRGGRHVNRCYLCEQEKDEAMLLVQGGGHRRQVCGACAWAVSQSLVACRALERSYANRNDAVPAALRQILDSARSSRALRSRSRRPATRVRQLAR
jgi:hypothetical protein